MNGGVYNRERAPETGFPAPHKKGRKIDLPAFTASPNRAGMRDSEGSPYAPGGWILMAEFRREQRLNYE